MLVLGSEFVRSSKAIHPMAQMSFLVESQFVLDSKSSGGK